MTHENAMRLFRYNPFRHIPRDQATVGAGQVAQQLATAMAPVD
jgi:hypothetical protein